MARDPEGLTACPAASGGRRRVRLYDTTLRDGTQGLGFNLTLDDKLSILRKLDEIGVDYVEGGYPLSNPKDIAFFQETARVPCQTSRLAAFGMTRRKGMTVEQDPGMQALLASASPVVTVVGKTWEFHVREVLGVDLDENLRMIEDTMAFFSGHGREAIYDAEHFFDAWKADPVYASRTLHAAVSGGATTLVLCDTNGGSLPGEVEEAVREVRAGFDGIEIGIHTHNDGGLAVANALSAVQAGATQVQGTINGVGERCGNVDLIVVAANLGLKMNCEVLGGAASLRRLTELSRFVDGVADRDPVRHQPFVGNAAFAHKGGMHVHAVQRNVSTYEHIAPESVGNDRHVVVSELSGVSNIQELLARSLGMRQVKRQTLKEILEAVNRLEKEGYVYEAAEASFDLLVMRLLGEDSTFFRVDHYQSGVFRAEGGAPVTTGLVAVRVDGETSRGTAEAEDPLSALEAALRHALAAQYPVLAGVSLNDRKFRAVERPGGRGTRVRVITEFTDSDMFWSTVALAPNVIDAGLECMVEGFRWYLARQDRRAGVSDDRPAGGSGRP
ncbi:MAG: citramalate synthase [Acidobacteriota bacterium]